MRRLDGVRDRAFPRLVHSLCIAAAIVLAAVRTWTGALAFTPDGVSYLDIADVIRRGVFPVDAIGYWSPLFPSLLAVVAGTKRGASELWRLHLLNFATFIVATWAFDRLLRKISSTHEASVDRVAYSVRVIAAYAIYVWATLSLIALELPTPDLLVAMLLLFVAGEVVESFRGTARPWLLGLFLGMTYLAKTAAFPLALALIALLAIGGSPPWNFRKVAIATASFAIVASPLVLALSIHAGRFDFGDAGKLNYAWYVDGVPKWIHWQGDAEHGAATSPTRMFSSAIPAYEFAEPFVRASYPPWYAPAYWHRGLRVHFSMHAESAALVRSVRDYADMLAPAWIGVVALAIFLGAALRGRPDPASMTLLLFSGTIIGMYALVHVEGRLVAAAVIISGAVLLNSAAVPPRRSRAVLLALLVVASAVFVSVPINQVVQGEWDSIPFQDGEKINAELTSIGLRRDDRVAVIGDSFEAYWARAGGFHIVAEVPVRALDPFRNATEDKRLAVLDGFRNAGARAVVADPVFHLSGSGWRPVGETGYSIMKLGDR